MSIIIEATYENGLFRPMGPVEIANGAPVRLVVDVIGEGRDPLDGVIGIVKDGPDYSLAEHHDDLLYGDVLRGEESWS